MTYQTREGGHIRYFESAQELLDEKDALENIDKLSFDGPDGTRLRLVYKGAGLFFVTIWDNKEIGYIEFPRVI